MRRPGKGESTVSRANKKGKSKSTWNKGCRIYHCVFIKRQLFIDIFFYAMNDMFSPTTVTPHPTIPFPSLSPYRLSSSMIYVSLNALFFLLYSTWPWGTFREKIKPQIWMWLVVTDFHRFYGFIQVERLLGNLNMGFRILWQMWLTNLIYNRQGRKHLWNESNKGKASV